MDKHLLFVSKNQTISGFLGVRDFTLFACFEDISLYPITFSPIPTQ